MVPLYHTIAIMANKKTHTQCFWGVRVNSGSLRAICLTVSRDSYLHNLTQLSFDSWKAEAPGIKINQNWNVLVACDPTWNHKKNSRKRSAKDGGTSQSRWDRPAANSFSMYDLSAVDRVEPICWVKAVWAYRKTDAPKRSGNREYHALQARPGRADLHDRKITAWPVEVHFWGPFKNRIEKTCPTHQKQCLNTKLLNGWWKLHPSLHVTLGRQYFFQTCQTEMSPKQKHHILIVHVKCQGWSREHSPL